MRAQRLLALTLLLAPAPALAWQTAVSATLDGGRAEALAVDGAGDVLAAGRSVNAAGDEDAIVAKLDGTTGAELWQRSEAGSAAGNDLHRAVAAAGTDVVVAGQVIETATAGDAVVVKLDATGDPSWRVVLDGGASLEDDALGVAVDGAGDVLVAAQATPNGATTTRFTVLKRQGADGDPVWSAELAGGTGSARAVRPTQGDDAFVAGDVAGLIVVARLAAATGVPAWRTDVTGSAVAADVGRVLAAGAGRVVVGGRMVVDPDDQNFAVVALDAATGMELWRRTIDGTASGAADNDDAFGVAVDAAGDVLAVGRISNADTDDDLIAVKLAGDTGIELWRTVVNGGNDNADLAEGVALDPAGDVFVVGTIRQPVTRANLLLLKLAGATGAEAWRREVNGSQDQADTGLAIAASGDDVVGGGRVRNGAAADAFAVVKRTGNGADYPCANGADDPGEACDDGNVVPGDGCRADCTVEICGDGIEDPQEGCDDGNLDDGDCCSAGCVADPDGTTCDDASACTMGDACLGAACVPEETVVCTPESPCHTAACDPADGSCSSTPKAEGATCDDANVCTVLDRCLASVCTGSFTTTCTDDEPCTSDGCDPASGCAFTDLEGFASVTCTFERDAIGAACIVGLPRPIRKPLDKARSLVVKASEAPAGSRRVGKLLRRAGKTLAQAVRQTGRQAKRERITQGCADALVTQLGDMQARNDALRAGLTP